MGHIEYEDFKRRIFWDAPTNLAQIITHIGLAQAIGFPPIFLCLDLIIECTIHYDSDKRIVVGPQGRVITNLTKEFIAGTFNIGFH
jgi:hypothetical protein